MTTGNARYFDDLAEREPALARDALRAAVRLNPRDGGAWMGLGLAAEQEHDLDQAAACFAQAENVDQQYLPAWTAANFFFRRSNDLQFWRAAARAAAMSYDDLAPLLALTDQREPDAIAALDRLGDSAVLERGYLRFVIRKSRWREGERVAARLSQRGDRGDRELLLNFIDRLLAVDQGEGALAAWNRLPGGPPADRARRGMLLNRYFQAPPSGHGFDWRVTEPPRGWARWEPSQLEFHFAESAPDAGILLEQWVVLDPGRYRLRFDYRTAGLAAETGLRWALLQGGRAVASSAVLAQAPPGPSHRNAAAWNVRVAGGLYDLSLIYSRVPGTIPREGRATLTLASLERP
jgi:tetratricopeptide (TPR) repeat protein